MIYIFIAAGIFLVDCFLKNTIEKNYDKNEEKEILNGKIRIRKLHNKGTAFNFLDHKPQLAYYLSGLVTLCVGISFFLLLARKGAGVLKLAFSFILGGALSNLYDRKKRGYVVDYFSFQCRAKRLQKIVFNISDMFIFIGTIISTIWDIVIVKKT